MARSDALANGLTSIWQRGFRGSLFQEVSLRFSENRFSVARAVSSPSPFLSMPKTPVCVKSMTVDPRVVDEISPPSNTTAQSAQRSSKSVILTLDGSPLRLALVNAIGPPNRLQTSRMNPESGTLTPRTQYLGRRPMPDAFRHNCQKELQARM